LNAPYQSFETSDGWINIGAANQANWERLLELIDMASLNQDRRFSSNPQRMQHLPELVEELNRVFTKQTTSHWLAVLNEGGLPAGPILSISEMHSDKQTLARDMVVTTQHATQGEVKTLGSPVKFSETPGGVRSAAPVLGQHGKEILSEHGYSESEVAALYKTGAIR